MLTSRSSKVAAALIALAAVLALAAPLASAAPRTLRPDSGFGAHGIVDLNGREAAGGVPASLLALAPSQRGAAFGLVRGYDCTPTVCPGANLVRYTPKGVLDPRYLGTGTVHVSGGEEETRAGLLVDGKERAVVPATAADGSVILRRYLPNATPDAGFGSGGKASFPCGCRGIQLEATFAGKGRIVVGAFIPQQKPPSYESSGTTLVLARFLTDGRLDQSFGSGGVARIELPPFTTPGSILGTASGTIYFGGDRCCTRYGNYLSRVSAKGRLDTRFGERTTRVFNTLQHENLGSNPSVGTFVLRPHGRIDAFGSVRAGKEKGFAVRFRPNGELQPGFGKKGMQKLPVAIESGVLDGSGGTLAAVERETLLRLAPNDKIDRSFGEAGGVPDRQNNGESPRRLTRIAGGKLVVTDLGESFCRYGGCEPTPTIGRFLIVPRHGKG